MQPLVGWLRATPRSQKTRAFLQEFHFPPFFRHEPCKQQMASILLGQPYGEYFQDRIFTNGAHAVADVYWPDIWRPERHASRLDNRSGVQLRLVLLFGQAGAGYVSSPAGDARGTAPRLSDRGAPNATGRSAHAKDLCDPDRVPKCLCHGPRS